MNLQEAINELEKGHRTFKAFEFVLDIAKTIHNSKKDYKASEGQILQTKAALSELVKQKETVQDEIKTLKAQAKDIIEEAKVKAQAQADKIIDNSNMELSKVQVDIEVAKVSLQKARQEVDTMAKDKLKLSGELAEINGQIDTLKTNLKKLMGE